MLPIRILIVDDLPNLRIALRIALERLGFVVVEAPDGVAAITQALRHLPDVALVDLEMPVLDGWQCIRALRRDLRTADLPAIAMSGRGDISTETAVAAGFGTFLRKPFTVTDLHLAISRCLQKPEELPDGVNSGGTPSPPQNA